MKKLFPLFAASLAMLSFSGCSDDLNYNINGEGRVMVHTYINAEMNTQSRADQQNADLADGATIWISNSQGPVRKYSGIGSLPSDGIKLVSGNYVAEVWAGDSVSATFDETKRYFKGQKAFNVTPGSALQLNVECKIANVAVAVDYSQLTDGIADECSVVAGTTAIDGKLTFDGKDSRVGYFMMPSFDNKLTYKLTCVGASDKKPVTIEGEIVDPMPATKYVLVVKHNGSGSTGFGGAFLDIEVREETTDVDDPFELVGAPNIKCLNFDATKQVVGEPQTFDAKKLWITAVTPLKEVLLHCDHFSSVHSLPGNDIDLMNIDDAMKATLASKGIIYTYYTHENEAENPEFTEMKLILDGDLLNAFSDEGEYPISVRVTDMNNRSSQVVLNLVVSRARAMANEVAPNAITTYATQVTVYGTLLDETYSSLGVEYRAKGDSDWQRAYYDGASSAAHRALAKGDTFAVVLTGLTPATTYEYRVFCDDFVSNITMTITTEAALQVPNADFEEWNTSETPYLLYSGDASNIFWDSGNHGSKLGNVNLTQPNYDPKYIHSGNTSARLRSQKVTVAGIGKFAAGNAFIGEFLAISGTNGVIGMGRPFSGRPKALRVYLKYTPGIVDSTNDGAPDIIKGQNDKGIVYSALMDDNTSTYKGKDWPVIVNTGSKQYFDSSSSHIIAYAERVYSEATPGDGLIEVTIPFEYRRTDIRPTYLLLTFAASKGGDFFAGGEGSTMYVDDVQLIY